MMILILTIMRSQSEFILVNKIIIYKNNYNNLNLYNKVKNYYKNYKYCSDDDSEYLIGVDLLNKNVIYYMNNTRTYEDCYIIAIQDILQTKNNNIIEEIINKINFDILKEINKKCSMLSEFGHKIVTIEDNVMNILITAVILLIYCITSYYIN